MHKNQRKPRKSVKTKRNKEINYFANIMMHKNQRKPRKSVKTKRNKEINYFANISCLVTQKLNL